MLSLYYHIYFASAPLVKGSFGAVREEGDEEELQSPEAELLWTGW